MNKEGIKLIYLCLQTVSNCFYELIHKVYELIGLNY